MSSSIVLDTGAWLLALAGDEPYQSILEESSALYVPGLVLAELDYHLRKNRAAMRRVMSDLREGEYLYEPPSREDLKRAMEIDKKFASTELGLVDSSVAATAERLRVHRILTIDSDFYSVRVGPKWATPLELVVPPRKGTY